MEERLQKFMAECGVASRRKCEEYILQGTVYVNGEKIDKLGTKVNPENDKVEFNGNVLKKEEKKVYIMLNKPEGYITSVKDEKDRLTILDIVKCSERIYPVGRLDYDSSGLVLLTNDGSIYNKIIHPREKLIKKYIAVVKGKVTDKDIEHLKKGVDIGGYITSDADATIISIDGDISTVEIDIHEGKNRQIRRMFASLNYEVISLKRIAIGHLKLGYLKKGGYRELNDIEMNYIRNLT
ncbi:pseudouridine synthase [Clostridium sp. BJN0001]|uniref:pseudouridine synthase n=1 Tax=Clostridium sp. BJN0001 TaxID=2930219 RepID=UPI001FD37E57|nr:pseudouridine synthase [Clostridium sp. BJN0001]